MCIDSSQSFNKTVSSISDDADKTVIPVKIAGVYATIITSFTQTIDFFCRYRTDHICPGAPLLEVKSSEISAKRQVYAEQIHESYGLLSDPAIEHILLLERFAEQAISHDALLIHGSALCMDGKGYLFTAPSGTGKSTHAGLWRQTFGDRCYMVNDDKPFLRIRRDGIEVCGSPWNGKHRLDTNTSVPLHAIVMLERGETNQIDRIRPEEAFRPLYQQVYHPSEKSAQIKSL